MLRDAGDQEIKEESTEGQGLPSEKAKEVTAGYECGMTVAKFNDIKEGDIFECFAMEEIKR